MINWTKNFKNEDYELLFENSTGFEVLQGINGKEDPFVLELPSLLDIGIMGTCHNKCKFCYQGHENRPNMSLENFKIIINQIAHHTNQVALGGHGDPNKHENFKEILEYCREKNIVPNYTTSGINLSNEEIEISKLCGSVAVSDYEQSYTYDAVNKLIEAGIKTNFHQLFSNITYNKCIKLLNGSETEWTCGEYLEGLSIDAEKINAIIFLLFKPQGAGRYVSDRMIPTEKQIETFANLVFNANTKFKVGMDSCFINHVLKYITPSPIQRMTIDTCEASRMSSYISPEMQFLPCSFCDHKTNPVYIKEDNLQYIWKNGEFFNAYRESLKENPNKCPIGF